MADLSNIDEIIELYTVLEQLHETSEKRLPLRVPDELTPAEYYRLAEQYLYYQWVHHAHSSLDRAEKLEPEWKEQIQHLRRTKLPQVIPSVQAVEANLLARDAMHYTRNVDYSKPRTFDSAYALAKTCVAFFPQFDLGFLTLGSLENIRGDWRAAISAYQRALDLNPNCLEAMVAIGNIWLHRVKILKARGWFEMALACDSECSGAQIGLDSVNNFLRKPFWLLSCKYKWIRKIAERRARKELEKLMRDLQKRYEADPGAFESKERSGFIDRTGELVIPHDDLSIHSHFAGTFLCCVQKRETAFFVDRKGRNVFENRFRLAESFSEGFAAVMVDGKWGFIELHGDFVIEPQFEDACSFSDGLAAAQLNEQWGFIDKNGEWVIDPKYGSVLPFLRNVQR